MPKVKPRPTPEESIKRKLLEAGIWTVGKEFEFASGRRANNHINMQAAPASSEGRRLMIAKMAFRIFEHSPDAMWGVPDGAQADAEDIADRLQLPLIRLRKVIKEPGLKTFAFESGTDAINAARSRRLVGFEDVTTEMTSLHGVLYGDQSKGGEGAVPGLLDKTVAIEVVWRRGTPEAERKLGVPISWFIEEPLPDIIMPDHPFFQQYGHLAIGELVAK